MTPSQTTFTPEAKGTRRVISYLERGMVISYIHGGYYRVGRVGLRKVHLIPCTCKGKANQRKHTLKLEKYKVTNSPVYFLRYDAPVFAHWRLMLLAAIGVGIVVAVLYGGDVMEGLGV